jgi:hypothetical protein
MTAPEQYKLLAARATQLDENGYAEAAERVRETLDAIWLKLSERDRSDLNPPRPTTA